MDLLEYQAKELFDEVGIPVLPSQKISDLQDLKELRIPYPVVLKSQVPVGERKQAGGIRFASNTIDAVAAARAILHCSIQGYSPKVVLAEAQYDRDREFYLAVVLDRNARRPVLLGSIHGGSRTDLTAESIEQVIVRHQFSPFYARQLAIKMGLTGETMASVSTTLEKMYRLFARYDLDLVEINPLGIRSNGEVMALDGKVSVNERALGRHPDLAKRLSDCSRQREIHPTADNVGDLETIERDGNIAIVSNGTGLTLATLDTLYQAGGRPASFLNIGGDAATRTTPEMLCDRLERSLERVTQHPNVEVVLVNLLGNGISRDRLSQAISNYIAGRSPSSRPPHLVVRAVGGQTEEVATGVTSHHVSFVRTLDDAVLRAVSVLARV
ncbi:acetate--CoA ligase family protein [Oscillatoriales cyanobacterium LEGE 11467]|uniref:Acetate--CoA ligase family protein n=1 Tax=Zarconia navalis LEGE 11467 TaxID=1828826 RepID=A0A928VSE8_9CYAN|nr:ATP-grasp domain-containing protein [Zarconia navalis]MBE9039276.1 acetate--CoA ligase family protein [Zarconia navalis LEGE 11467]